MSGPMPHIVTVKEVRNGPHKVDFEVVGEASFEPVFNLIRLGVVHKIVNTNANVDGWLSGDGCGI